MRACSAAETALAAAQLSSMEACRQHREIVDAAVRAVHRRAGDERIECATVERTGTSSIYSRRRLPKIFVAAASSPFHVTVFAPQRPARDILRKTQRCVSAALMALECHRTP